MTPKEEFIEIYTKYITRNGAEELLEWLKRTDFFTAPASTKYHCACEGGLVMHSVSVFNTMMEKHYDEETDNIESFAICGLLHDLCKAQFYKVSSRNVKNEQTGAWEKVPYYAIDDQFPYGHGEKSVFLIERKMHLKIDEAISTLIQRNNDLINKQTELSYKDKESILKFMEYIPVFFMAMKMSVDMMLIITLYL